MIRYQGTLVDVTERREMERQLRHKKNFSPRLLESLLPELILVIDTEGTALSVHIHAI